MAYQHVVDMARSQSLMMRVAACAATEEIPNPESWAANNMWRVATFAAGTGSDWAQVWEYYSSAPQYTADLNPDTGARPTVITDAMIKSAVQGVRATETGGGGA